MQETSDVRERTLVGDRVTIYRRGLRGIWTADFFDGGRHSRRSLGTRNKKIAVEKATKLAAEVLSVTYERSKPSRTTTTEAISAYVSYLRTNNRARRTITRYTGELTTFSRFAADHGADRLCQVTMSLLDQYRAWRAESRDRATVYHETVVIKQLFSWAKKRSLLGAYPNPLAEYEFKKPRPKEKKAPTLAEVDAILKECTPRRQAEIGALAFTGMRSGELQGLTCEGVDLAKGWLDIDGQVDGDTKTEGSVRSVPMHPRLLRILHVMPRRTHGLFFTAEPSAKYPGGGRPVNTKKLNDYFKSAAARVGISGFTVHSLRHFFKTFCINAGVPREMVDRWQGHSDGSVAMRYYHVHDPEAEVKMNGVPFDKGGRGNENSDQGEDHD